MASIENSHGRLKYHLILKSASYTLHSFKTFKTQNQKEKTRMRPAPPARHALPWGHLQKLNNVAFNLIPLKESNN